MGYRELMSIPIRTFWMMNVNAVRLAAESDMRSLSVVLGAQSPENYRHIRTSLELELGEVVEFNIAAIAMRETVDVEGLAKLKLLSM